MAIGFGLGADFMVDTPLGELPNPLVTLAAQGGQEATGIVGSQAAPSGPVQPTGITA